MARQVKLFNITSDEKVYSFTYEGRVLAVESRPENPNELEFWAETGSGADDKTHKLRVFNTGQNVPDDATYVGSTGRASDGSVYHLYEVVV